MAKAATKIETQTKTETETKSAKAAPATPAAPAKGVCSACGRRRIGTGPGEEDRATLKSLKMCNPCATEGLHSNAHSDHGHEGFEAMTVRGSSFRTKAALEEWKAQTRKETERCWICRPELDASRAEYVPANGTSREGMVVHARGGISGKVACLQEAGKAAGGEVEVKEETRTEGKGKDKTEIVVSTTLTWRSPVGAELTVVWDGRGRFQYGPSVVVTGEAPRKIRNVSEALRVIAAPVA